MVDSVEMIKEMILQQIKPINFGDELNLADILGEESVEGVSAEPEPPDISIASQDNSPTPLKPVENIVCHVCSKTFANSRYFRKHFTKHTGRFSCPSCKKVFSRKETQIKHISKCINSDFQTPKRKKKISQDEEICKYYCEQCNKKFTRRENYEHHVMVHKGVQIICSTCHKKLSSFKSFRRHCKTHELPKNKISCQHCPSEFSLKSNLQRHIRLHQHKSDIFCEKCKKTLRSIKNLEKHKSQDTISSCPLCFQKFCLEPELKKHLKNDHPNLWFKCKECTNTSFMTRVMINLREHVKRHHSIEIQGDDCFKEGWYTIISS